MKALHPIFDDLVANAKLQAERDDQLVLGQPTELDGPYLGQTPPGRACEVFTPGILSTTAHEYHLSFAPEGINTEAPDAHPWIAPDESLLLFDSYCDPGTGVLRQLPPTRRRLEPGRVG